QGSCILIGNSGLNEKHLLQALPSAQLDTDRSHKTSLTADEKMYLAVYIYYNYCIFMCVYCGRPDIVNAGSRV
ncbi:unnamed protein product, partial [Staurois parvus]